MSELSAYKSASKKEKALHSYQKILEKWPVLYEENIVKTAIGDTYALTFGEKDATPLLLLHGGGGNSSMWLYNAADLAKNFRVYAVDIVGEAGKSSGNRPTMASNVYADWLNEVLDKLNLDSVMLCGASLGGVLAHRFALAYPKKVNHLILLAPPSLLQLSKKFMFKAIVANLFPTKSAGIKFLTYISSAGAHFSDDDLEAFITQIRAYKANKEVMSIPIVSDEDIKALQPKTLILLGDQEVLFDPIKAKNRVETLAPSIDVEIVKGAKHTISIDQPQIFYQALMKFCAS